LLDRAGEIIGNNSDAMSECLAPYGKRPRHVSQVGVRMCLR
jgi:hypothetical protein